MCHCTWIIYSAIVTILLLIFSCSIESSLCSSAQSILSEEPLAEIPPLTAFGQNDNVYCVRSE